MNQQIGIPQRTLGRLGEKVSMVGLGGAHLTGSLDEGESIRIVRTFLDEGGTFLDNCWDYGDGEAERRMGKALRDGYRQRAFLMTKVDGQTKEAASRQLEESLRRLGVDTIDLLQLHEVIRPGDPDRIFGASGAIEALLAARRDGKIRYIGFTGHKDPDIHLKMLKTSLANGFVFDAVQMPLNVADAHYHSFEKKVLPELIAHGIGVLGMKPLASGKLAKSNVVSPTECLHYAMNLPTSTVITGCDSMDVLRQALDAARSFRPLSPQEVASLLTRTASIGQSGQYEPWKNTHEFDGTVQNPEWLG